MISAHLASLPSPGAYAKAWRAVCAMHADAKVKEPGWDGGIVSAAQMRAKMAAALDLRINIRGGQAESNEPVDIGWIRDARRLDDILVRRVRVYQFERPEMREKFGHLLARHDD